MLKTIKGIAIGASVVAGVSAISAPAIAARFTPAGDITVFQDDNGTTKEVLNYSGNPPLSTILTGTSTTSGGNVELRDKNDNLSLQDFLSPTAPVATLNADFGDGTSITFSSLTGSDWFDGSLPVPTYYGASDLANEWFDAALEAHGTTIRTLAGTQRINNDADIFNALVAGNVFQRFSDPNIAYVEKNNGLITFGLAGHQSAGNLFDANDPLKPLFSLLTASEVVKVSYNGADPVYMYSFAQPFDSGVVNTDGFSHNGTFEFTVSVPEPSAVLGLIAVGGLLTVCKRKSRKA